MLAEAGEDSRRRDVGVASEVIAVASGFGVVLLEGSHVYAKSCGGPSIHRGTALSTSELAVLARALLRDERLAPRAARKHLGATQAEAFDEAAAFVAKNDARLRKLREAPELLETGVFSFGRSRGFFSRLVLGQKELG